MRLSKVEHLEISGGTGVMSVSALACVSLFELIRKRRTTTAAARPLGSATQL